jgi:hypothetical protein
VIETSVLNALPVSVVPFFGASTFSLAPVFTVIIGGPPSATAVP